MINTVQSQVENVFSTFFGRRLYPQKFVKSDTVLEFLPNGETPNIQFSWDFQTGEINGRIGLNESESKPFKHSFSPDDLPQSVEFAQGFCQWLKEKLDYSRTSEYVSQAVQRKNSNYPNLELPFLASFPSRNDASSIAEIQSLKPSIYSVEQPISKVDLKEVYDFCSDYVNRRFLQSKIKVSISEDCVEVSYPLLDTTLRATKEGKFLVETDIALPVDFHCPTSTLGTSSMNQTFIEWFSKGRNFGAYFSSRK